MKLLAPALKSPTRRKNASDYVSKAISDLSTLTSDEWVAFPAPRPLPRVPP